MTILSVANTLFGLAGGGVLLGQAAKQGLRKISGSMDAALNAGSILDEVQDFASQTGLVLDDVRKQALNLTNVASLYVANGQTAGITINGENGRTYQSVRLDHDHGLLALVRSHKKLDDPAAIAKLFETQPDGQLPRQEIMEEINADRNSWARPSRLKALLSNLWDDPADNRWAKVREPLDLMARVLAASPQKDINLTTPWLIALKITNPETEKADIIVCPTFGCEQEKIKAIQSGAYPLQGGKLTAKTLRDTVMNNCYVALNGNTGLKLN